jgi:DNA invertase Pin-like site-specific DNA recombinase
MLIGYGRTSTTDQQAGIQAQERDLSAAGCDKLRAGLIDRQATAA